jgi:hypothetical protein
MMRVSQPKELVVIENYHVVTIHNIPVKGMTRQLDENKKTCAKRGNI